LTQAFFARLLERRDLERVRQERGRFRSYLLVSLKHFLANEWHRARAEKRGGACTFVSLDEVAAEERYCLEPPDTMSADRIFERRWALTLLEQVLRRRAASEELDRTPLNLTSVRPAISKENVLLIEGMHDQMVSSAPIELWQSWGQPEIWRLPHGHISTTLSAFPSGLPGRVLRWLEPRRNNGRG
jgi:hypothetical protein